MPTTTRALLLADRELDHWIVWGGETLGRPVRPSDVRSAVDVFRRVAARCGCGAGDPWLSHGVWVLPLVVVPTRDAAEALAASVRAEPARFVGSYWVAMSPMSLSPVPS